MHMRHNALLQHYACAVYIINAMYFYHAMTSSWLQGLPFHSPAYIWHWIACMQVRMYVMEDNQIRCSRGQMKQAPLLVVHTKIIGLWYTLNFYFQYKEFDCIREHTHIMYTHTAWNYSCGGPCLGGDVNYYASKHPYAHSIMYILLMKLPFFFQH